MSLLESEIEALLSLYPEASVTHNNDIETACAMVLLPITDGGTNRAIIATLRFQMNSLLLISNVVIEGRGLEADLHARIQILATIGEGDAGDGITFADSASRAISEARKSNAHAAPCAICLEELNDDDDDRGVTLAPCAHGPFHTSCVAQYWNAVKEWAILASATGREIAAAAVSGERAARVASAVEANRIATLASQTLATAERRSAISTQALSLSLVPSTNQTTTSSSTTTATTATTTIAAAAAALSGGSASARRARREAQTIADELMQRANKPDASVTDLVAAFSSLELGVRARAEATATQVARSAVLVSANKAKQAADAAAMTSTITTTATAAATTLPPPSPCPVCRTSASSSCVAMVAATATTTRTLQALPPLDSSTALYVRNVSNRHKHLWAQQLKRGAIIN
jgi:hypothetical protein